MLETHPFGNFVPPGAKYLLLGSFPGRYSTSASTLHDDNDWFYGSKRSQFWPIIEWTYGIELKTKIHKQALFTQLGIAIADIIFQCERKENSNLDSNLANIVYNITPIEEIIVIQNIERVFFTSRFVEVQFRKAFKRLILNNIDLELVTLPSPSPRFAKLTKAEKVIRYKALLPLLPSIPDT